MLSFRVQPADAELLAEQFAGDVTPGDLVRLPQYTAYLQMLIDGVATPPFTITTNKPAAGHQGRAEIIRQHSRIRSV
jgi:hypothetical protein